MFKIEHMYGVGLTLKRTDDGLLLLQVSRVDAGLYGEEDVVCGITLTKDEAVKLSAVLLVEATS